MDQLLMFRKNRYWMVFFLVIVTFSTIRCVTVNVNFPENTVQKATDDYVKELYRAKKKDDEDQTGDQSSVQFQKWFQKISFVAIPSAVAQSDLFKIYNDRTRRLQSNMKGRVDQVIRFKKKGVLGETNDGLLVIRNSGKLKNLEKKRVERWLHRRTLIEKNFIPRSSKQILWRIQNFLD